MEIFLAFIFAIIAGVIIHYSYIKIKPEPKLSGKTIYKGQMPALAALILPNKKEIKITKFEEIFGREDFEGVIPDNKLQFIGRQHFKIIKNDDGRYIEDMDSANGTKLDKREIKGSGQQKLEDDAKIRVADVLDLEYKVVIDGK
ncbi:MAG: FHA domain-containing protein [Candidatus Methanoperedens sp.]|nr:FHA domain-containing protein [Candidatus Methanoperedens sp.]